MGIRDIVNGIIENKPGDNVLVDNQPMIAAHITVNRDAYIDDDTLSYRNNYVAVDLETTGLNPTTDAIIEIAAIRYSFGREQARFQTLVNPQRQLTGTIVKLTGLTDAKLKRAPLISTVLPQFLHFLGSSLLVAHNAKFDVSFIKNAAQRIGIELDLHYTDTLYWSRTFLLNAENHKLETMAKNLGFTNDSAHRALSDAIVVAKSFECFISLSDTNCESKAIVNSDEIVINQQKSELDVEGLANKFREILIIDDYVTFRDAIDFIIADGIVSVSSIQRALRIGYSRAARIVDHMEEVGIISSFNGSGPRSIYISKAQWIALKDALNIMETDLSKRSISNNSKTAKSPIINDSLSIDKPLLSQNEQVLLSMYRLLNGTGQDIIIEQVNILVTSGKYPATDAKKEKLL